MPLSLQIDTEEITAQIETKIRDLRQEHYGRMDSIDNTDILQLLHHIGRIIENPALYDEYKKNKSITNQLIVKTLRQAEILSNTQARALLNKLAKNTTSSSHISPSLSP